MISNFTGRIDLGAYVIIVGSHISYTPRIGCYLAGTANWAIALNYANFVTMEHCVVRGGFDIGGSVYQFVHSLFLWVAAAAGRYIANGFTGQYPYHWRYCIFDGIDKFQAFGGTFALLNTTIRNCTSGGLVADNNAYIYGQFDGSGNIGTPVILKNGSKLASNGASSVTGDVAGQEFKCGARPAEAWASLTANGPSSDSEDQKYVTTIPANPGPWTVALGRALNGMLGSGMVRVHDTTAGIMMAEVAPAPGAGQFSVDYATGVVTFNTADQTHAVRIYCRPVVWQNCNVSNYV